MKNKFPIFRIFRYFAMSALDKLFANLREHSYFFSHRGPEAQRKLLSVPLCLRVKQYTDKFFVL